MTLTPRGLLDVTGLVYRPVIADWDRSGLDPQPAGYRGGRAMFHQEALMADHTTATRSVNQIVAAVFGAIYTLVGIAGFFVSETFAAAEDNELVGFQVNHLHNIVHLLIGLALLAAATRHATARSANLAIGATYLLLGVLGPLITGNEDINIIALNTADNWLHIVSGVLLLAVGLLADKGARDRTHT